MKWLVLVLFVAIPAMGGFFAWQGACLLRGRPALMDKRFTKLTPGTADRAKRHFGVLAVAVAVALFVLVGSTLLLRWNFDVWRNVLTMILSVMIIWAWLLNRRFGLNDA